MDKLKEQRMLVTVLIAIILTAAVYFLFSAPQQSAAIEAWKGIDESYLGGLPSKVDATPTQGDIWAAQQRRWHLYRQILKSNEVYTMYDLPMEQFFPEITAESRESEFRSRLEAIGNDLFQHYKSFAVFPEASGTMRQRQFEPLDPDLIPFDQVTGSGADLDSVPLQQKRYWILQELVNALRLAKEQCITNESEFTEQHPPICALDGGDTGMCLEFRGEVRQDPTKLYRGIPFTLKVRCSLALWPYLRTILHTPPSAIPEDILNREASRTVDVTRRRGLRFDRIAASVEMTPITEQVSARLEDFQDAYQRQFPDWQYPPQPPRGDDFRAELERQYREIRRWFGQTQVEEPPPAWILMTISGEALDFTPWTQQQLWQERLLSPDVAPDQQLEVTDIAEILKPGIPAREANWESADGNGPTANPPEADGNRYSDAYYQERAEDIYNRWTSTGLSQ